MLDEAEFSRVSQQYAAAMKRIKEFRQVQNVTLANIRLDDFFQSVMDEYAKITGWRDIHHNAIIHHRATLYGPDCPSCGRPLRTPKARLCMECGYQQEQNAEPNT